VVAIGVGNGQPPYENWNEEDENVDPDASKQYAEDDPEKYLYPLYFPPPSQGRERKKPTPTKGTDEDTTDTTKDPKKGDD